MSSLTKDERKAAADLEKLEEHKRAVGPTMEKGGSTLATVKRRAGFLDDEDFEDACESEDEHWRDPDAQDGEGDGDEMEE